MDLYPFQKEGIEFMRSRRSVLNADEMGLGKSVQAIKASAGGDVLVICPAFLKLNWQREFKSWTTLHEDLIGIVYGDKWPRLRQNVVIINYDILPRHYRELRERKWGTIICDEAHYMQTATTNRTRHILGWRPDDPIDGLTHIPAVNRIALSGTPCDQPWNLWPILCWLQPGFWLKKGFSWFEREFCPRHRTPYGMKRQARNLDKLGEMLRGDLMIRRTKAEVLKDLPEKTREVVPLPVEFPEPEAYSLSVIAKHRRLLGMKKAPAAAAYVKGCLDSGDNPVVFAYHRDVLEDIGKRLGVEPVTGDTPMTVRQMKVDNFQAGLTPVFLGQIEACGTGLTLTAGRHVIFAENDWRPYIMKQAEDRLHRIGQKNAVLVTHLVVPNSLDERISRALIRKQDNVNAIFGENESIMEEALGLSNQ